MEAKLFDLKDDTKKKYENRSGVFRRLGASNHTNNERQPEDYYSTDPVAVEKLIQVLDDLDIEIPNNILEPCVGGGHIANVFKGKNIEAYDIVNRGYPGTVIKNFLELKKIKNFPSMSVTNPPYKEALSFIKHDLELHKDGEYVCYLLKIQFLEGQQRRKFFDKNPPKYICVFSKRIRCSINGREDFTASSAMCYAWYIWQKGNTKRPRIIWI